MSVHAATIAPAERRPVPGRSWCVLLAITAAFLAVRVPVMYRQPGGQDESNFSVPGWMILEDGIPRVPFLPARNRDSVFYKADVALFTLPPAYFYWQSVFYAVFGPGHGTARLASTAAGLIALWFVYRLGRSFYDERAALIAVGLFSLSRFFYFPCLIARPDMLCGMFGLSAIASTWSWHRSAKRRSLALAGGLIGLGLLTHPFAIVYALQIGAWTLFRSRSWSDKIRNAALLVGTALAVFALWVPLIVSYPELFRVQFFNNVLDRSGPGLLERLVFPWSAVPYHGSLLIEHAGPWQLALTGAALLAVTIHDLRRAVRRVESGSLALVALAWSSIYLLIACQGTHPTKGYWVYPAAFLFLAAGRAATLTIDGVARRTGRRLLTSIAVGVVLVALMLPGAGLRATAAYVQHWSDPIYDDRSFVALVLADYPADAAFLVDPAHVFQAYLQDRSVIAAEIMPLYFDVTGTQYDYLIASRFDLERDIPSQLSGRFLRSYGDPDDPFACYAEVYAAPKRPAAEQE